jgi:hypothetical protein
MYIVVATPQHSASRIACTNRQMSPEDLNGKWSSFLILSYTTAGGGTDFVRFTSPPPLSLGLSLVGFCMLRVPFTLDLVGYLAV